MKSYQNLAVVALLLLGSGSHSESQSQLTPATGLNMASAHRLTGPGASISLADEKEDQASDDKAEQEEAKST